MAPVGKKVAPKSIPRCIDLRRLSVLLCRCGIAVGCGQLQRRLYFVETSCTRQRLVGLCAIRHAQAALSCMASSRFSPGAVRVRD